MVLLRRVIGDALRARRQAQRRTLREVSTAANVSLGYLSEIERGQKEASSELLASICDALGAHLSDLLREVSDTVETAEQAPVPARPPQQAVPAEPAPRAMLAQAPAGTAPKASITTTVDGEVSVTVRQDSPLKATLLATRKLRRDHTDVLTPV
ncbi:MAG: helix-turn-helix domain-containing protein [Micromonosporaceae bacterium]|nr:helix-turn-helix domain-containing protein [Micromonosporaceae bacterium]